MAHVYCGVSYMAVDRERELWGFRRWSLMCCVNDEGSGVTAWTNV